jgi:hypothetical protein
LIINGEKERLFYRQKEKKTFIDFSKIIIDATSSSSLKIGSIDKIENQYNDNERRKKKNLNSI